MGASDGLAHADDGAVRMTAGGVVEQGFGAGLIVADASASRRFGAFEDLHGLRRIAQILMGLGDGVAEEQGALHVVRSAREHRLKHGQQVIVRRLLFKVDQ